MTGQATMEQRTNSIAIVGIGCWFPGGDAPESFWKNIRDGMDCTREVPEGRWGVDPKRILDSRPAQADRVYATRGGFIEDPRVDVRGLHLDGIDLGQLDPVFRLAVEVSRRAWVDARPAGVDLSRVGVVFGNIVLPTETATALTRELHGRIFTDALGVEPMEAGPVDPRNAYPAGLPAALVARALGLGGLAYTIDAACASSLYALKLAVDELRSGRADMMLSGGISRPDSLYTQMGFSQLRALSARAALPRLIGWATAWW